MNKFKRAAAERRYAESIAFTKEREHCETVCKILQGGHESECFS